MKKQINWLVLFAMVIGFISCKKDPITPPVDDSLKVEGQWQFESLNFLTDEAKWDNSVEYTSGNYFGYAPAMFEGMRGVDFLTQKTSGNQGYIFQFISNGQYNQNTAAQYWYWNYTNENKSLEISQINKSMPPYDFSIMNISDIQVLNDSTKLVFKAQLNSRKSGGNMTDVLKLPVEITFVKGTAQNPVKILIQGQAFVPPNQQGDNQLLNVHWKLKAGSDVYDPGMEDTDNPNKAYLKIVALNLADANILNYRYAYPMGIVSPKQYTQDELGSDILKVKLGGSYGTPEQIIRFHIESVNISAGELKLKEETSGEIRTFIKIDDISTGVDKADYNLIKN